MSYHGWGKLKEELALNIREELAEDSSNDACKHEYPHYIMLLKGFNQLGINLNTIMPSVETQRFIAGVFAVMNHNDPAYIAGGAYALESSAVPELEMTFDLHKLFVKKTNQSLPDMVTHFFTAHIGSIEIAHENRLKETCAIYIQTDLQKSSFKAGFTRVIAVMDQWWEGLYEESKAYIGLQ